MTTASSLVRTSWTTFTYHLTRRNSQKEPRYGSIFRSNAEQTGSQADVNLHYVDERAVISEDDSGCGPVQYPPLFEQNLERKCIRFSIWVHGKKFWGWNGEHVVTIFWMRCQNWKQCSRFWKKKNKIESTVFTFQNHNRLFTTRQDDFFPCTSGTFKLTTLFSHLKRSGCKICRSNDSPQPKRNLI